MNEWSKQTGTITIINPANTKNKVNFKYSVHEPYCKTKCQVMYSLWDRSCCPDDGSNKSFLNIVILVEMLLSEASYRINNASFLLSEYFWK